MSDHLDCSFALKFLTNCDYLNILGGTMTPGHEGVLITGRKKLAIKPVTIDKQQRTAAHWSSHTRVTYCHLANALQYPINTRRRGIIE